MTLPENIPFMYLSCEYVSLRHMHSYIPIRKVIAIVFSIKLYRLSNELKDNLWHDEYLRNKLLEKLIFLYLFQQIYTNTKPRHGKFDIKTLRG